MDYPGSTKLFPLPHFVMFPHVKKIFHIFEPRYVRMTLDALAGDRFITLATLLPEADTVEGQPAIYPTGCLTRIEHHQALPDHKFNLLLTGLCRVHLSREMLTSTPYRVAEAQPLLDQDAMATSELREKLISSAKHCFSKSGAFFQELQTIMQGGIRTGALADLISFFLPLPTEVKQRLLANVDVTQRVHLLLDYLDQMELEPAGPELLPPPRTRKFPPDFSNN